METIKKAIASGIMISIGCAVYLSMENKVVGALLFTIGLFVICAFGLNLFTGKVGYVLERKNYKECLMIWCGNLIGCVVASILLRIARPHLNLAAAGLVVNKLGYDYVTIAILSMFCGALMYVAVENYRTNESAIGKLAGIFLCVPVFILCGFEHSVADMCYMVMGIENMEQALQSIPFILMVSVFNGVGSIVFKAIIDTKKHVEILH